jgi:competence protein ComEA
MVLGYGLALALGVLAVILVVTRRPAGQAVVLPEPPTPSPVRVHVTGAVAAPGVYPLPAGSIVLDAITAAGGPLAEADPNALNLARPVKDGDQIVVPLKPQPAATVQGLPAGTVVTPAAPSSGGPLNLNTATAAELETLPGIGPSLAQRIVDYRTEHGPFDSIEAVTDVPGIGEGKFEAIKDLITV